MDAERKRQKATERDNDKVGQKAKQALKTMQTLRLLRLPDRSNKSICKIPDVNTQARVLQELASTISTAKGQKLINLPPANFTRLTSEGGAKKWHVISTRARTRRKCLLDRCDDWVVSADASEWENASMPPRELH
ncbi:hypothetical protein ElyMa_005105400 [Elysia marginata]|uniref:Uncharacterized protein n=1 Tax=Elysia marginata TaxID=1093978 RepID=A0AAV4JKR7_9GAST|nr:hypothetical protein ElyMa_005105400 [Elysia marginata]